MPSSLPVARTRPCRSNTAARMPPLCAVIVRSGRCEALSQDAHGGIFGGRGQQASIGRPRDVPDGLTVAAQRPDEAHPGWSTPGADDAAFMKHLLRATVLLYCKVAMIVVSGKLIGPPQHRQGSRGRSVRRSRAAVLAARRRQPICPRRQGYRPEHTPGRCWASQWPRLAHLALAPRITFCNGDRALLYGRAVERPSPPRHTAVS
jgi:hypothetical protein